MEYQDTPSIRIVPGVQVELDAGRQRLSQMPSTELGVCWFADRKRRTLVAAAVCSSKSTVLAYPNSTLYLHPVYKSVETSAIRKQRVQKIPAQENEKKSPPRAWDRSSTTDEVSEAGPWKNAEVLNGFDAPAGGNVRAS